MNYFTEMADEKMSMDIRTDSDGCPVGVACPMDGFQTDCPFLWTKDCPHWHPILKKIIQER